MAKIDLPRESFTSKFGVIAAAAGSAVGLGNIWRFPYIAGENGGGAFLLVYLLFIIAIGMPVMLSEFSIGRKAQRNAIGSFKKLAPGTPWYFVGVIGVAAAFLILAFYSTVAGWTLEYVVKSATDSFADKTGDEISQLFAAFHTGTFWPLLWQLIFMGVTLAIVMAGIKDGIERYVKILMPLLVLMIIVICIRSLTLPGAAEGVSYLFSPDFSRLTTEGVLAALGQAFFSLSLGMGTLITYGSYISKKEKLGSTVTQVTIADTVIAMLAGIAIFPAVFAFGIAPDAGPGLVFETLPNVFQEMAGGYFFGLIFFILLSIAALTSSISILEVVVAYMKEELNMTRRSASIFAAAIITLLGVLCTLSFGVMQEVTIFETRLFDLMEFSASDVLLPIGGLLIVLFIGWYLGAARTREEVSNDNSLKVRYFPAYMFLIKFIAPVAIAIVFLYGIGLLNI